MRPSHTTPRASKRFIQPAIFSFWQCGTHLEGCIRSKHWAFVWAHDALRCQRGTEQDGSFTHYVPSSTKRAWPLSSCPPSAKSMAPDRAHYVSVQQGRKRFTHLSHAANTRQSHVLVKFDMMLAGLDQPKGLNDFCSKAENIKNK